MNPAAVRQADAAFHAKHPELNGRQLTLDPKDRALRAEWMADYKAAEAQQAAGFGPCGVGAPVLGCGGVPPPTPAPTAAPVPPKPECTIEVRASKLSPLGYYHLYIVFTDAAGEQHYLRGGPSANGGGLSQSSGELSGGSSNAGSNSSSGSGSNSSASSDGAGGGPFGNIHTSSGKYEPGSTDWDPAAKTITIQKDSDACALQSTLQAQLDAVGKSGTRYNPLGPNSNTTVYTVLKNSGLTPKLPDDVWAPGMDQTIAVPAPAAP